MKKFKQNIAKQWQFHLMLLPPVVIIFIFSYIPLYGLIIAFQKYNPALGFSSPFIGIGNFTYLFSQPNFVQTIWNTFYIALGKIIGGIIVPVTFALLLNEFNNRAMKRFYQTIIYVPNFLSWVILGGVMMDILSLGGVVNLGLGLFGIGPIQFLGDPKIFPWTMIVSDIWKTFGFGTVVYLAALTSIDPSLYEAAVMDGAKRWKQTQYITLPMVMPIIVLMSILALGNVLNAGFDQIFNLYGPIVYNTGDIIDTYVYRIGMEKAQYALGTAIGMFKALISGTLICFSYVIADKLAGYRVF
jgi:putative aldouronate transport system permease protein